MNQHTMPDETVPIVRAAVWTDTEHLPGLRLALWPHLSPEQHRQEIATILSQPEIGTILLCIYPGEEICGFVEVSLRTWAEGCQTSPVGYLEGWYVAEHARGQGVGAQLTLAAEEWARAKGCTEMASDTELDNHVSQIAHQHLGYELVERLACFRKSLIPPAQEA
jgi:aminoglycoside 6'-N-acetyltransferase I